MRRSHVVLPFMKLLDNVLNRKQGEKMGYEDLSYEEVIVLIKQGNNFLVNELITRLEPVINKVARKFSTNHSILDDLIQRGRIATSKVIEKYDFNHESKSKFETYLNTCLRNEFKTAMSEISKRDSENIGSDIFDLNEQDKNSLMLDTRYNPEEIAIYKEAEQELKIVSIESLSGFEQKVYNLRNLGYKNGEISKELKISTKSIENALTRIKQKFSKKLKENDSK